MTQLAALEFLVKEQLGPSRVIVKARRNAKVVIIIRVRESTPPTSTKALGGFGI